MLGFGQERVDVIVSLQELSRTREEVRIRIDAQVAALMAERMRIDPFNQPGRKYTPCSLVEVHTPFTVSPHLLPPAPSSTVAL